MRVLVTGPTGYIGTHLVPRLLSEGHQVAGLVREPNRVPPVLTGMEIVGGDIRQPETLRGVSGGRDVVIHLAVLGHLRERNLRAEEFMRTNVSGTLNLLKECIEGRPARILCMSSTAAFGVPRVKIIDEQTPPHPVTPYGRSKHEADLRIQQLAEHNHLPVVTLRLSHVYGPGDTRDFLTICRMIKNRLFPQVGLAPNYYPALYIDDAVDAIVLAMENGRTGQIYIVTDDDPHDLRVVRRLVNRELGRPTQIYPVVPKYLGVACAWFLEITFRLVGRSSPVSARNINSICAGRRFSIEKARRELGFEPKVGLEAAIHRTVQWYLKAGLL
jgi:nucleoside-diphosphate-sugar epimerase